MKKRLMALALSLVLILVVTACGGNKKAIVGTWELTDGESTTYGVALQFNKDGTLSYGLGGSGTETAEFVDAMKELEGLLEVKYKVINDTTMEVTASALFGLTKETAEMEYSLDGDTLVFDGATYARVK